MKKFLVGMAIIGVCLGAYYMNAKNEALQAKLGEISASLVSMQAKVGIVMEENDALKRRVEKAEEKITVLQMVASWYGPGFHGKTAADGSTYNQYAFTCAHKTLPFGTVLVVEGANGHRVPVVVTDRGPFIKGRDIDLSYATAEVVGLLRKGVGEVKIYQFRL